MRSRTDAQTAAPCASSAGCALYVSVSVSAGPSKQSVLRDSPSAASTAANVSRAAGSTSTRSFAIPGFCDPCPGNSRTTFIRSEGLEANDRRAPSEPGAERDHQYGRALLDAPALDRLVERDRDRR